MKEQYKKVGWGDDDVISFLDNQIRKTSFVLEKLKNSVKYSNWGRDLNNAFGSNLNVNSQHLIQGNNNDRFSQWFEEGIDCKIMRVNDTKGWRKGKIRVKLTIEFELWEETEESDSPLDNFREK